MQGCTGLTQKLQGGNMLHELYEDMNPDYRPIQFLSRKTLITTIENKSMLPESGLAARNVLSGSQLQKVEQIRKRRLARVLDRFVGD
jgi:hypothetical protein